MAECPICCECYEGVHFVPKCLPCGHTFCDACIQRSMTGNKFWCVICHTKHVTTDTPLPTVYALITEPDAEERRLLCQSRTEPSAPSLPACEGTLNVLASSQGNPGGLFALNVDFRATVLAARVRLAERMRIDHTSVTFYYDEKKMPDAARLEECGLEHNAIVRAVVTPRKRTSFERVRDGFAGLVHGISKL